MAKIEEFGENPELFNYIINVSASVGKNGVNSRDDVLIVQALLKYGAEEKHYFRNEKFPIPTGSMCQDTAKQIKSLQRFLRKNGHKISIDGRIDPAKGNSAYGKKGRWTIRLLNELAFEIWLLSGAKNDNYILDIARRYPQVMAVLDGIPVGTLNIPLESSSEGVGTLNIALE